MSHQHFCMFIVIFFNVMFGELNLMVHFFVRKSWDYYMK